MSDKGVCRTAPATPGLLITLNKNLFNLQGPLPALVDIKNMFFLCFNEENRLVLCVLVECRISRQEPEGLSTHSGILCLFYRIHFPSSSPFGGVFAEFSGKISSLASHR